jgi:hypothetical protein
VWNRSGNTGSGNGCVEFAKETLARLGDRVKLLGCLADSGFYRIELIQYFEGRALEYVLAAPLSQVFELRLGVSRRNLRQKILWVLKRLDSVGDNRIAFEPQLS